MMKFCIAFSGVPALLFGLALVLATQAPALAADGTVEQAVAAFKAGRTDDALTRLLLLLKTDPKNATVHYYLGQCYQNHNQAAKAKPEYQWVISNSKDAAMLAGAKKALASMKDAAAPATEVATGRPSVIDFFAVWCVPCKKFEPTFNKVAADYKGKVDFLHVDVDDPKQKKLVDKYKVTVMPTFVFRDATGKARLINEGVMKEPEFVGEVDKLLK
ncbi:MAG: thioredoxin fold domain-containing protein [Candidatus Obscuribacterales bacterium]|nr:thioredoxin fold domain-containing protein [Candidatus Obscuribacterales bacterium]